MIKLMLLYCRSYITVTTFKWCGDGIITFVGTQSIAKLFSTLSPTHSVFCFLATLSATGSRSLKLLCAAEIDCILEDGGEFVELKTQQFGRFGEQFPVRNKGFQFKGGFLFFN